MHNCRPKLVVFVSVVLALCAPGCGEDSAPAPAPATDTARTDVTPQDTTPNDMDGTDTADLPSDSLVPEEDGSPDSSDPPGDTEVVNDPDGGPGPSDEGGVNDTEDTPPVVPMVTVDLVDMFAFTLAPNTSDPWYTEGLALDEICEPVTYGGELTPEGNWFDVDTSFCGYLTVVQPLQHAIPKGATLRVRIVHESITEGETPWTLGVALGDEGEIVWTHVVQVPSLGALYDETWVAEKDYAEGESIFFHISNHGENVWSLTLLTATYPE